MSKYYNAQRKRNMYDPKSSKPFKLSRSKISDYLKCARCFYLDRRLGVGQPPGFPFTLNLTVDALLKKEFDIYREKGWPHPIMDALTKTVPSKAPEIKDWQNNFKGVQSLHKPTNLLVTGAIDGLWYDLVRDRYYVAEFKATSRKEPVTEINPDYGYKEQVEVYQWLLRRNGLTVNDTAFFVYLNGTRDCDRLSSALHFDTTLIQLECDDSWVESTIEKIHACLNSEKIPAASADCDYCAYREAVGNHVKKN